MAESLSKPHEPALSNDIPYELYTYFSLSLFFIVLVAPKKQFLSLKLSVDLHLNLVLTKHLNQIQYKHFQFWSNNCFVLKLKDLYQFSFQFYVQNVLCYAKK